MTIIDRLMVLFRIPNISYLVLNRETRKRLVNTRERGAKMIAGGHKASRRKAGMRNLKNLQIFPIFSNFSNNSSAKPVLNFVIDNLGT